MRTRLALAAVLWSAGALAGAQAQVKETLTVNVVEVPVTVVDHDGTPVRGLTAANFKILDEGVERKVSAFDAVDFASIESLKATSPLNPAARRNFMLLFDLSFSSPSSIKRAQLAARDFVTKMVQRRDRVAVGTIDADKGFRLVTAFTTDRTLLNAAIANPATFRGEDPLQIAGRLNVEDARAAASNDQGMNAPAELNETLRRMNRNEDQFNRARVQSGARHLPSVVVRATWAIWEWTCSCMSPSREVCCSQCVAARSASCHWPVSRPCTRVPWEPVRVYPASRWK